MELERDVLLSPTTEVPRRRGLERQSTVSRTIRIERGGGDLFARREGSSGSRGSPSRTSTLGKGRSRLGSTPPVLPERVPRSNGKDGNRRGRLGAQGRNGGGRAQAQGLPPGHLPSAGECRVCYDNRPPGHQPPPTRAAKPDDVLEGDGLSSAAASKDTHAAAVTTSKHTLSSTLRPSKDLVT